MGDLKGKVALITGGGSGIGRATALAFAREGARVVIGNRNSQAGEETVRLIQGGGEQAAFYRTDVSSASEVAALIEHAVRDFGQLDVAFNNAGIEGAVGPLAEQDEETFESVMDINVKGVWLSMKYEIQAMLEGGGGAIVNNSSIAGLVGVAGLGPYVASKHAVCGLTRTAALDYATDQIRVNAVNPAVIETDMANRLADGVSVDPGEFHKLHPIGRMGRVDEVAQAVVWLCSEKASFVTGQCLPVDGAFTAR